MRENPISAEIRETGSPHFLLFDLLAAEAPQVSERRLQRGGALHQVSQQLRDGRGQQEGCHPFFPNKDILKI
jgi:hypothetical protein